MLKRMADRIVSCGGDIADANNFFRQLKDKTNVKLYVISEMEIDKMSKAIPNKIPVLKGTLSVHQMVTTGNGLFRYRSVSCFCQKNSELCPCFKTKQYNCQIKPDFASHKNIHKKLKISDVYSSDSDSNTTSMDEECELKVDESIQKVLPDNIKAGKYMLAAFKTDGAICNFKYKYVVVAQEEMDDDGEVKVMCLKTIKDCGKLFRADENDISYIRFEQIIKILPEPRCRVIVCTMNFQIT